MISDDNSPIAINQVRNIPKSSPAVKVRTEACLVMILTDPLISCAGSFSVVPNSKERILLNSKKDKRIEGG